MVDWNNALIVVDWGTTNRRGYTLDGEGTVLDWFEDECGVTSVSPGGFKHAVGEIRRRLGIAPMLLAGMVGSNRGWVDVPYVDAPASLGDLASALHRADDDIAIVSGVRLTSTRCDIMRGEEVQALGAVAAGMIASDAHICHPGTHTKWITMSGGAMTDFRTAMTGEMFALLKAHSILQLFGKVSANAAFLSGVATAARGEPLLDALFEIRSRVVLGALAGNDAASYASGLLIGTDVITHSQTGGAITLLGRPELCTLYAAALKARDCPVGIVDGAKAFVAGMHAIRKIIA